MTQVSFCQSQSKLHSVQPPTPLSAEVGGGGLSLQPNLKKGGLDRTAGNFSGGLQFSHNKLKSEIFNDKKSL